MQSGSNTVISYPPTSYTGSDCSILRASNDKRTAVIGLSSFSMISGLGVLDVSSGSWLFYTNVNNGCASISGDGRCVAYTPKPGAAQTQLIWLDLAQQTNMAAILIDGMILDTISLNKDGSRAAYCVKPPTLPGWTQVNVWDAVSGSNILASVNRDGQPGNGNSRLVAISSDGSLVLFNSQAEDLVETDHNGCTDVFVRDLVSNRTRLISENRDHSGGGNSVSVATAFSADGKTVTFKSLASDLVENDFNGTSDLFMVRIVDVDEDKDADGLPDDWEVFYFGGLDHGPGEDADLDGSPNLAEFEAGTNPTDSQSVFRISELVRQPETSFQITWTAVTGKTYRVQYKDNLEDAAWSDLSGDIVATGTVALKDLNYSEGNNRYYRVLLVK